MEEPLQQGKPLSKREEFLLKTFFSKEDSVQTKIYNQDSHVFVYDFNDHKGRTCLRLSESFANHAFSGQWKREINMNPYILSVTQIEFKLHVPGFTFGGFAVRRHDF